MISNLCNMDINARNQGSQQDLRQLWGVFFILVVCIIVNLQDEYCISSCSWQSNDSWALSHYKKLPQSINVVNRTCTDLYRQTECADQLIPVDCVEILIPWEALGSGCLRGRSGRDDAFKVQLQIRIRIKTVNFYTSVIKTIHHTYLTGTWMEAS